MERNDFYADNTIWDHEFCGPDDDCECNSDQYREEAEDEVENGWDPANPSVPAEEARHA